VFEIENARGKEKAVNAVADVLHLEYRAPGPAASTATDASRR
jgi:hypothetical protein